MENVDERYLRVLKEVTGKTDLVKIITGMRGTGKTTLVRRHMDHLRSIGIEDNAMCYLDRDGYGERKSSEELEEALKPCLEVEGDHFIFIDEVQKVPDWESTVEMLISRKDCDVYLTESNLYRPSTKLSCRTMEIDVLPLSFKEFLELHKGDREMRFYQYLEYGPLPSIKPEKGKDYCFFQSEGTYCTILHKDIVSHTLGRPHILDTICRSLFSNIGKVINAERISVESGLSDDTVRKCLKPLVGSRLFYHAKRYDIVKKRTYPTKGKYYATDPGMRNLFIDLNKPQDLAPLLENTVFFELLRRGYDVYTGSIKDREVDFVTMKDGDTVGYYQMSQSVLAEGIYSEKVIPLKSIKDNYPKTVLTLDRFGLGNDEGIEIVNLIDWLLERPSYRPWTEIRTHE